MTPTLDAVIAQVESSNNPRCLRFEDHLYGVWSSPLKTGVQNTVLANIRRLNVCSLPTAEMIACTSWGRYQLLGQNLYDPCRCQLDIVSYLYGEDEQRNCFDLFLKSRRIDFTLDQIVADEPTRTHFITVYNGPAAVDAYWERMQQAILTLSEN